MAEQLSRELQRKVEDVIDSFSQKSLAVQKKAAECSVKCFDQHQNYKQVGQCIQQCQVPFENLANVTQKELGGLQSGVQNCMSQCVQSVSHLTTSMATEQQKMEAQSKVESCSMDCMKQTMSQVADVDRRLDQHLKNHS